MKVNAVRAWTVLLASLALWACLQPPPVDARPEGQPASSGLTRCYRAFYDLRQLTGLQGSLGPRALRARDVTGDGREELLLLLKDKGLLVILRGESAGGFSFLRSYPVGSTPSDLAVEDVNADGHQDVLVVGHFANALTVLLGSGGGSFRAPKSYPLGNHSQRLALADFNRDGHLDVVTKNGGSAGYFNITLLLGRGDGTFGAAVPYATPDAPMDLQVSDLNQDGRPDVLVALLNRQVAVWLGQGNGTLLPSAPLSLPEDPWQILMSDANGDGREDMWVVHGLTDPGFVSLSLRGADGTFGPEQRFPQPSPHALLHEDIDGDGLKDLLVSSVDGHVLLQRGLQGGSFASSPLFLYSGSWPTALAASDLDMSGLKDVAWTAGDTTLELLFNVGACGVP